MTRGIKGRFPFRLGTTSYILPDDVLPNARFLAPLVDDVALLLFESGEASLPSPAAVAELAAIARGNELTYTLHLPLDLRLGDADESVRRRSVESVLAAFERTRPLAPKLAALHFETDGRGAAPADADGWRRQLSRSVAELLAAGIAPETLCVETLAYPFELVEPVVRKHNLSVCMDAGHLLLAGRSPEEFLGRHGARCRLVHLHGVAGGRDHRDLSAFEPAMLARLVGGLGAAGAAGRVVTIEVFDQADLEKSLEVMERLAT